MNEELQVLSYRKEVRGINEIYIAYLFLRLSDSVLINSLTFVRGRLEMNSRNESACAWLINNCDTARKPAVTKS